MRHDRADLTSNWLPFDIQTAWRWSQIVCVSADAVWPHAINENTFTFQTTFVFCFISDAYSLFVCVSRRYYLYFVFWISNTTDGPPPVNKLQQRPRRSNLQSFREKEKERKNRRIENKSNEISVHDNTVMKRYRLSRDITANAFSTEQLIYTCYNNIYVVKRKQDIGPYPWQLPRHRVRASNRRLSVLSVWYNQRTV